MNKDGGNQPGYRQFPWWGRLQRGAIPRGNVSSASNHCTGEQATGIAGKQLRIISLPSVLQPVVTEEPAADFSPPTAGFTSFAGRRAEARRRLKSAPPDQLILAGKVS
jgi:hypothetical protein